MADKVKPLTKAEWERGPTPVIPDMEWVRRLDALVAALFRYRERTRGLSSYGKDGNADAIAAELGIE